MTTIYNYDQNTGEFLNSSKARRDPVQNRIMVPRNATTTKPPTAKDNQIAVFSGYKWSLVADYRGFSYYLADKSFNEIDSLGVIPPSNALHEPPEPTLNEIKTEATARVIAFATQTRATIAGNADQYKLAGWNQKVIRSERVLTGTASPADIAILNIEAKQRNFNETAEELAQSQAIRGAQLSAAIAVIDGMESEAINAITNAEQKDEINKILLERQARAANEIKTLLG